MEHSADVGIGLAIGPEKEPLPVLIADSGNAARFAWEEFIYGRLANHRTRRVYRRAIERFFEWCHDRQLELARIAPADVGRYLDSLPLAATTKKVHLTAIRHLFDELVTRHAVVLNPALSARTERVEVIEGKTSEITARQVRKLFATIDTSHVVGLRDRAIVGILVYTAVRVGAVAKLRHGDFYDAGDQHCLRFNEKGGKSREIPVRHDLRGFLLDYLRTSGLDHSDKSRPLFRTTTRRTKRLTTRSMTADDMARMVKRRLRDAGLSLRLSPHSFRVCTLTNLLKQGVPLEDVQTLAGHKDPRTTRL